MIRLTLRNLMARKVRLVMSTLAIILGIGFLTGVLTFSSGLRSTFDGIISGSTPDATARPKGTESWGSTGGGAQNLVSPAVVHKVAGLPQVARADGSVEGQGMYLLDKHRKIVGGQGAPTLAFNYTPTKNLLDKPTMTLERGHWPTGTGEIAVDKTSADKGGYRIGDRVSVIPPMTGRGPVVRTVRLVGITGFNGGGTAGSTLLLFSTRQAQDFFLQGQDKFTSISLTAADGVTQQELVTAVKKVLPADFTAVTGDKVVAQSKTAVGQFLGFITTFLVVFAVIAIIVGGFIIANTFSILVAQRVRELALLRALGAGRRQVTRSVLIEALVMSLVGSLVGIGLGLGLARGLAALFRGFGLDIPAQALGLTPTTVVAALAVGVLVTMASAYFPARRAARVAPVEAMQQAAPVEASLRRRTLIGLGVLAVGTILAVIGVLRESALFVGIAAVVWILTAAIISPVLGRPVLSACRGAFARVFGATGRLAGDNAIRNPRRTGATASALMIGLALVSAVGVMAASMSKSTDVLVDQGFHSSFVIQGPGGYGSFPTSVGDQVAKMPGVSQITRQQFLPARVGKKVEYLTAVSGDFTRVLGIDVTRGSDRIHGREAMMNAGTAREHRVRVGDRMRLRFPGNRVVEVNVAGIYADSQVTDGILVPLAVVRAAGVNRVDSSINVNLAPGAPVAEVKHRLDRIVKDIPIVTVQDKAEFADSLKGQVNQLLYMIYALLALAVVIAVIGIVNTLGLSVIERTREIGLLRAIGLSRRRLRRMITLESVTISLMGATIGLGLGLLIGVLLQRTLSSDLTELGIPFVSLVVFLAIAVLFGVLAALVPAARASRMKVLDAIASE